MNHMKNHALYTYIRVGVAVAPVVGLYTLLGAPKKW
jgi:hypothetical protein